MTTRTPFPQILVFKTTQSHNTFFRFPPSQELGNEPRYFVNGISVGGYLKQELFCLLGGRSVRSDCTNMSSLGSPEDERKDCSPGKAWMTSSIYVFTILEKQQQKCYNGVSQHGPFKNDAGVKILNSVLLCSFLKACLIPN